MHGEWAAAAVGLGAPPAHRTAILHEREASQVAQGAKVLSGGTFMHEIHAQLANTDTLYCALDWNPRVSHLPLLLFVRQFCLLAHTSGCRRSGAPPPTNR